MAVAEGRERVVGKDAEEELHGLSRVQLKVVAAFYGKRYIVIGRRVFNVVSDSLEVPRGGAS